MDLEITHIGNLLYLIKIRIKHLLDLKIFSNWNIGMLVDCEITQMGNLLVFTIFRTGNLMDRTLRYTQNILLLHLRKVQVRSLTPSVYMRRLTFCYVTIKIRLVSMYNSERVNMTSEALNWIGNEVDS